MCVCEGAKVLDDKIENKMKNAHISNENCQTVMNCITIRQFFSMWYYFVEVKSETSERHKSAYMYFGALKVNHITCSDITLFGHLKPKCNEKPNPTQPI